MRTSRTYNPPNLPPLSEEQKSEIEELRNMKDEDINFEDIPRQDFSDASFYYARKVQKENICTTISKDKAEWKGLSAETG